MLNLFGFPFHMAPGEAEAECALLQKEGIVDAVLSEDVDTLMFGCGTTLRNWSSEGTKGNKTPTHVSLYDAKATKEGISKLDREGMVLVALMSGGDYITEGIPGCGIKVACEAARAGYGKSLCRISRSDDAAFEAWRTDLAHEVQTNQSKFFRVKHKALQIPADFPNMEVLGYYTHPVVSSSSKILKLKDDIKWDGDIDVQGLRIFVADAFEWTSKIGAIKFIRGLAPVLLVHKLRVRGDRRASGYGDLILTAINEMELVRSICGQRVHICTDGMQELRVVYHPNDIVKLDLDAEPDNSEDYGRDGLAPVHDDDQIEAYASDERSASPVRRGPSQYDPTQPDKLWILRTIAKVGVPLKVEDYEESLRNSKKPVKQLAKPKAPTKKAATKGGMPKGALDQFVKVTKSTVQEEGITSISLKNLYPASGISPVLPPIFLAPSLESKSSSQPNFQPPASKIRTSTTSTSTATKLKARKTKGKAPSTIPNANPWSLAQPSNAGPTVTKATNQQQNQNPQKLQSQRTVIDLLSSPEQPRSQHKLSTPKKHTHSPIPSNGGDLDLELPSLPDTVTRTRGSQKVPQNESLLLTRSSLDKEEDKPSPRKKHSPSPSHPSSASQLPRSALSKEPISRILEYGSSPLLPELNSVLAEEPISRVLDFGFGSSPLSNHSDLAPSYPPSPDLPPLGLSHTNLELPQAQEMEEEPLPLTPSPPRQTYRRPRKVNQFVDLSSSPLPPSFSPVSNLVSMNTSFSSTTSTSISTSTQSKLNFNPISEKGAKADVKKGAQKTKKKTHLLLRESIGMFQEVDEDELEMQRVRDERKYGPTTEGMRIGNGNGNGNGKEVRRGRTGKERVVLRVEEVEVLDLRDV